MTVADIGLICLEARGLCQGRGCAKGRVEGGGGGANNEVKPLAHPLEFLNLRGTIISSPLRLQ